MSGTLNTTEYIGSGSNVSGTDSGTTIVSGGVQYLGYDSGTGTAIDTIISAGGFQYAGYDYGTGSTTSTTIDHGGTQNVGESGGTGTATTTTIASGGLQGVGVSGGTGTAIGTTISGAGEQDVGDDGIGWASTTTIQGRQYVGIDSGTGTATNTTIDGNGTQFVGDFEGFGYATSTTIDDNGEQYVGKGGGTGTATGTTIDGGGYQYLGYESEASGSASNTTVSGRQTVGYSGGNGTATDTTIADGGIQYVGVGNGLGGKGTGTAIGTTIDSGGNQIVGVGGIGTATSTTIDGGGTQTIGEDGSGAATTTTISGGGTQEIGIGGAGMGTATSTTIDSGGVQEVGQYYATGTAITTTISGGGTQYVGYEANGAGTATSTTIDGGGFQYVGYSGGVGTATSTYISGGEQVVGAGGTASDDVIYSGGVADVSAGGIVDAPVISGGTLELASGASVGGGGVDFAAVSGADGGTLDLTGEGSGSAFENNFAAAISGFAGTGHTAATSDIIEVVGTGVTGDDADWTQSGGSGTLKIEGGGNVLEALTLDGTYVGNDFEVIEFGSVDQVTYDADTACYCGGTLILTERGEIEVERLAVGDRVVTASGEKRPIRWIGRREIGCDAHPHPSNVRPVRIFAGALGPGAPVRDLWVSPGHALFLDGALVPAHLLVDGATIVQEPVARASYWHVELDSHDLLVAEGVAAESYLDAGNRGAFANGGPAVVLHPDFARAVWDERACAPKLVKGPALARLQRRLARRAEQLGATTTVDPGVRVLADGEVLTPVSVVDGLYRFAPPEGTRRLRLRSRAAIPAALPGLDSEDTRRLGVMAMDLEVDGREFALDGLGDGWDVSEADGPRRWRWTNGDAALPLARALALRLHPLPAYPLIAAGSRRTESAARGQARA